MSDIEAKIQAVLGRLDSDVERVAERLDPILQSASVDALSAAEQDGTKTAVPYAVTAYALSSMLFAYLRSEGRDTAVVMPELARVKERLEKLSARQAGSAPGEGAHGEPAGERSRSAKGSSAAASAERAAPKSTGKHLRFEDGPGEAPKKAKRKTRAR